MRAPRPRKPFLVFIPAWNCELRATGNSAGGFLKSEGFSGGYVRPIQLLTRGCGPVAGKNPSRIRYNLTAASCSPDDTSNVVGHGFRDQARSG